jgi:hypothetical protein
MESVKLAVMGAGSVRCTVPVLATLATYFGERPLEVALYDADEERLDLFDRFARTIFVANNNQHTVTASAEYEEVAEGADKMILQVGPNCAAKQLKKDRGRQNIPADEALTATLDRILKDVFGDVQVVSLQGEDVAIPLPSYYRLDWPGSLSDDQRRALPHQVLRWIRAEDTLFELFRTYEHSPLKEWLEDAESAEYVSAL